MSIHLSISKDKPAEPFWKRHWKATIILISSILIFGVSIYSSVVSYEKGFTAGAVSKEEKKCKRSK